MKFPWVVLDMGNEDVQPDCAWGPFDSKKAAREWAREHLCDCCPHPVIRLVDKEVDFSD